MACSFKVKKHEAICPAAKLGRIRKELIARLSPPEPGVQSEHPSWIPVKASE